MLGPCRGDARVESPGGKRTIAYDRTPLYDAPLHLRKRQPPLHRLPNGSSRGYPLGRVLGRWGTLSENGSCWRRKLPTTVKARSSIPYNRSSLASCLVLIILLSVIVGLGEGPGGGSRTAWGVLPLGYIAKGLPMMYPREYPPTARLATKEECPLDSRLNQATKHLISRPSPSR